MGLQNYNNICLYSTICLFDFKTSLQLRDQFLLLFCHNGKYIINYLSFGFYIQQRSFTNQYQFNQLHSSNNIICYISNYYSYGQIKLRRLRT
ncbi:unnamed protein product [Paramecium pentaurelia]|uniref:Uncharacterized protein n=1 Tax=Paramecium pentaurelia TaxID=43138 RepID=A0A8S1UK62_9CILI|nr:unnamed protein product [Paramecium pentaurelia]